MNDVMEGVRIVEVAEHTFVPAASAVLAEWGAEVIKIEHVERGDAMRGLASSGTVSFGDGVHVLLEHSNRGKKSLGLDLKSEAGLEILYKLIETADVFLTNKTDSVLAGLGISFDQVRAHNPDIIYARGTGQGTEGPDADKGSYDMLAYWSRAGIALALTPPDDIVPSPPPAPAFGDSIGAMTIAGGIMGALFQRERTGEATTVDVSLLGTGLWSMAAAVALSIQLDSGWRMGARGRGLSGNPLVENYKTSDGGYVALCCLQAGEYWAEACEKVGLPELATDERFADHESLLANGPEATELFAAAFAARTAAEWRETLQDFSGQWAMVQDVLEAASDPQSVANGYIQDYADAGGNAYQLVTPPVQFGGRRAEPKRAPEFNEHGDEILEELGYDMDRIIELKVQNVVA